MPLLRTLIALIDDVLFRIRAACVPLLILICLAPASHAVREYPMPPPDSDMIGDTVWIRTQYEDTLLLLAREHGLGIRELGRANPDVDPWLPGDGTRLRLPIGFILPPVPREGVVVNLAEYRLYYYPEVGDRVLTAPVGIGRSAFGTPVLETRVTDRIEQPSWTPPVSVREEYARRGTELAPVVPPGPDNPLGEYALMLGVPGYLIHGTNQPYGVGSRVSHGCLRLYPEDIERLIWEIPVGTPVRIIHEPYKVGWDGDDLLLEAHRPLEEFEHEGLTAMVEALAAFTDGAGYASVNWDLAERVAREAKGVPVVVGRRNTTTEMADGSG